MENQTKLDDLVINVDESYDIIIYAKDTFFHEDDEVFVVKSLSKIFGYGTELSVKLMLETKNKGKCLVGTDIGEIAVTKRDSLISLGITCQIKKTISS